MRNVSPRVLLGIGTAVVAILIASPALAAEIRITVTNDQPAGGFALAPVWFGVQNGSFNVFTQGSSASSADRNFGPVRQYRPARRAFSPAMVRETTLTSGGSLIQFLPGQSNSTTLNVSNPAVDQYLSYAGMVVPSNDFFQGNATPLQIFNSNGSFIGPITIKVYGSDIWDSDTEQQSTSVALTFIQGQNPEAGRRSRTARSPRF